MLSTAPRYWVLKDGKAIPTDDVLEWGECFESANRIVQQNHLYGYFVSTVFLGVDHNFIPYGPPMLWETMIFGPNMGHTDLYMARYTCQEDAIAGHQKALGWVRAKFDKMARKKRRRYSFYLPLDGSPAKYRYV